MEAASLVAAPSQPAFGQVRYHSLALSRIGKNDVSPLGSDIYMHIIPYMTGQGRAMGKLCENGFTPEEFFAPRSRTGDQGDSGQKNG